MVTLWKSTCAGGGTPSPTSSPDSQAANSGQQACVGVRIQAKTAGLRYHEAYPGKLQHFQPIPYPFQLENQPNSITKSKPE